MKMESKHVTASTSPQDNTKSGGLKEFCIAVAILLAMNIAPKHEGVRRILNMPPRIDARKLQLSDYYSHDLAESTLRGEKLSWKFADPFQELSSD
jgi:hypothetical protein